MNKNHPQKLSASVTFPLVLWDLSSSWGSVFGISGSAMTSACCCQGDIADLGLIRGHKIWDGLSSGSFVKGVWQKKRKKKKKFDNDLSRALIATNCIFNPVAPVSKLIWKEGKACTNYFAWQWTMLRNFNCCSSNSSQFVFVFDACCQNANKSGRKKSGRGMIPGRTEFKQQINTHGVFS